MNHLWKIIRRYFLTIFGVFALFFIVALGFCLIIEIQLPDVAVLKEAPMQVPLRVYTQDGTLIGEYGESRRIPVTIDEVPKPLIQAILATEDQRFYSHPGVDFIGLFRAFKVLLNTGQKSQGASTITMQVARNFFLSNKKTYIRKIREILLALKIERSFPKDKILELYLNKVYFGNRAYGVAAAADVYYGKRLNELTLAEMAMIAGLPQAPSKNNPLVRKKESIERRNHVLLRMEGVGDITQAQYLQALNEPDHARYHGPQISVNAAYVGEMARQYMVEQFGPDAYDKGYEVYTTLNTTLQNAGNLALQNGLIDYSERHGYENTGKTLTKSGADWQKAWQQQLSAMSLGVGNPLQPAAVYEINENSLRALLATGEIITTPRSGLTWTVGDIIWLRQIKDSWRLESFPKIQGAFVSLNPQTGAILALSGGFDYTLSQFNRATQAERQPGSSIKPFIYSAALNKGFTMASIINDAPVVMKDSGENTLWRPQNDTREFYGPTRLHEGLIQSRNMVSIRLLQALGIDYTLEFLARFGFNTPAWPHSLSVALGAGVTSPMNMSAGYAIFANGGYRITPYFIDHIVDEGKNLIFKAQPIEACEACITHPNLETANSTRVVDPQNIYIMTQALRDVLVHGTGSAAKSLQRGDIAGKTGTTNDKVDAWFIGFNSQIVATVWVGYDDLRPTHEYGAQAALPIWIDFMKTALAQTAENTMPQPPGIVTARIDAATGLLAGSDDSDALFEVFRQDNLPQQPTTASAGDTTSSVNPSEIF